MKMALCFILIFAPLLFADRSCRKIDFYGVGVGRFDFKGESGKGGWLGDFGFQEGEGSGKGSYQHQGLNS